VFCTIYWYWGRIGTLEGILGVALWMEGLGIGLTDSEWIMASGKMIWVEDEN
jgi:hypothetical protein